MLVSDADSSSNPSFLARKVATPQLDLCQVQRWLSLCESHHGSLCDGNHKLRSFRDKLRFIDIELNNLVSVDSMTELEKENIRYVTLSYVWGKNILFRTLLNNEVELHQPGSLNQHSPETPRLSRTIRDGILLAKSLGFRYIWVDSLCIIQDDQEDWKVQASLMDQIYGNSSLNICGAGGDHADFGLLGTTHTPREFTQPMAKVGDAELLVVKPVESRIRASPWNSRAWTFQERILSPRSLILVDDRVYFQCRKATWSEEVDLETTESVWSLEMRESPLQAFDKIPIRQYADYVNLYTKRNLSFASDRLLAFEGIAAMLSTGMASSMLYGLPRAYFDWAMLWDSAERSEMTDTSKMIKKTTLPTWSWCGWSGGAEWRLSMVDKTLLDMHEWLANHTWINWYCFDEVD